MGLGRAFHWGTCPHFGVDRAGVFTGTAGVAWRCGGTRRHQTSPLQVVGASKTPHMTPHVPLEGTLQISDHLVAAGGHPCPQSRVPEGGPGDWHRCSGDLGVMYRSLLVPKAPEALVPGRGQVICPAPRRSFDVHRSWGTP